MSIIEIFNPSESGCGHSVVKVLNDDGSEQDFRYLFEDLRNVNFISDDPVFCAIRAELFERNITDRKEMKRLLVGLKIG